MKDILLVNKNYGEQKIYKVSMKNIINYRFTKVK